MWTSRDGRRLRLLRSDMDRVGSGLRSALARGKPAALRRGSKADRSYLYPLSRAARHSRYLGVEQDPHCGCTHPVFAAHLGSHELRIITRRLPDGTNAIISIRLVTPRSGMETTDRE